MEYNKDYMMDINFEYSKEIFSLAKSNNSKFIYASSAAVYGLNEDSKEIPDNESPLNIYAESKLLFDKYIMSQEYPAVGLRYFNVYGPREQHKGSMASVAFHLHNQLKENEEIKLFEGCDGYENGEQRRDFIHVEDVVKVNLWFLENQNVSGIFNVGTGKSQTFNEVAHSVINWNKRGKINYIPFPEKLKGAYQSYTEADISRLREVGYKEEFLSVQEGVKKYLDSLESWPNNEPS